MKILWHSATPWSKTGYGVQSRNWEKLLIAHGHEVNHMATSQIIQTPVYEWEGIRCLPLLEENIIGVESMLKWIPVVQPDMIITLYDAWVMNSYPHFFQQVHNWYPMAPIDHKEIPPGVLNILKKGVRPIAYSKDAFEKEKKAGLKPAYIPHGVDTKVYKPTERMDMGNGKFVVGIVAANIDERKAWNEMLFGFRDFHLKHPDSILYCHTNPVSNVKYNLITLCKSIGLTQEDVIFSDKQILNFGIEDEHMAQLYSSFDVLLSTTAGEGFGVPIIESEACGTPVIVTNTTAMPELCGAGWIVEPEYPPRWTNQDAFWEFPSVPGITEALEKAYDARGDKALKEKAREFALQYDFDVLYDTHWVPFLEEEEQRMVHQKKNPKHAHRWAKLGVIHNGDVLAPCRDKTCQAALRIKADGTQEVFEEAGFTMNINGLHMDLDDDLEGVVAKTVCVEATKQYKLDQDYKDGDVIIDVGAHIGCISTYLGMKYPNTKILSFEPHPSNYKHLIRNLKANKVKNVKLHNKAVTGDGRDVKIYSQFEENSGSVSMFTDGESLDIKSLTLKEIFRLYNVDKVKLLKMDCEGAEYEILYASEDLLDKVENISIEIHENNALNALGYNEVELLKMLKKHIPEDRISYNSAKIYDQKTVSDT